MLDHSPRKLSQAACSNATPLCRVVLVLAELRSGGAERVVINLATAMKRRDIAVEIICLQNPGSLATDAAAAQIPVIALQSMRGYDIKAVWKLAAHLRRFHPDVINVHDRSSLPYVVLANTFSGRRPIVFSAHGLLVQDEHIRWRDQMAGYVISQLTAVSQPSAEEYSRLLGWNGSVEIIDNGVPPVTRSEELRRQLRSNLGLSESTFVYLAVGNIKPEKGFEDLLAAATILRDREPNTDFCVLIAGGIADQPYHESLLEQQRDQKLETSVRFLGMRRDTQALYSAADGFILSSRKEGLPMVLLEAMSAGLPVIATSVGAVPNVVRAGIDGLVVPPASPQYLAEAMKQLQNDASLREQIGFSAHQRVIESFTLDAMSQHYVTVYQNALNRTRTPSASSTSETSLQPHAFMLGPMRPLTGGMATVIENLFDSSLKDQANLYSLNTGKTTRINRTLFEGIWAQVKLLFQISSAIRNNSIHIVHIHTCEYFGFWRDCIHAVLAKLHGCRLIWHIHGARFDQWAAKQGALRRWMIKKAFEHAAAVIVLSPEWKQKLAPFASKAHWHIVPNGIPMPKNIASFPTGRPSFLFLGDWSFRKGVADLVKATQIAVKDYGFPGKIVLAGFEKEPGQRAHLDQLILESGCQEYLEVVGLLFGSAKENALASSHCLVLPSYGEGLPIAILEAMGYGRAVLATQVGAIPELITHGREGLLFEPGDTNTLATYLCQLASDLQGLSQMGLAARQKVESTYSLEVMASKIAAIYKSLQNPK